MRNAFLGVIALVLFQSCTLIKGEVMVRTICYTSSKSGLNAELFAGRVEIALSSAQAHLGNQRERNAGVALGRAASACEAFGKFFETWLDSLSGLEEDGLLDQRTSRFKAVEASMEKARKLIPEFKMCNGLALGAEKDSKKFSALKTKTEALIKEGNAACAAF